MKIIGILIILLGFFLFIGGFGGAVLNRVMDGQNPNCESAQRLESQMETAYKEYQEAKGTAKEAAAAETYRKLAAVADNSSRACAERNQQYFYYFLGLAGVGIVGLVMVVFGLLLVFLRRRRRAEAV